MANNTNSAAHWCKSVIEEVVPGIKSSAAGTNPVASQNSSTAWLYGGAASGAATSSGSTTAASNVYAMNLSQDYLQYYQLYNKSLNPSAATATTTAVTTPAAASTTVAPSYMNSALYYNNVVQNMSSAAWAGAMYGASGAASAYSMNAASTTANVAPQSYAAVAAKKPNPTRFAGADTNTQQPAATHQATTTPKNQNDKQPPSLKEFVRRSFANCRSDVERDYVNKELQKLIAKVTSEGRINVHRWDLEPIPTLEIPEEKVEPPKKVEPVKPSLTIDTDPSKNTNNNVSKKRKSRFSDDAPSPIPTPTPPPHNPFFATSAFNFPNTIQSPPQPPPPRPTYEEKLMNRAPPAVPMNMPTHEELKMREQRANRFQGISTTETPVYMLAPTLPTTFIENKKQKKKKGQQQQQQQHYAVQQAETNFNTANNNTAPEFDMESLKIVGTCQKLEKDYLRLTTAPLPAVVRPEVILRKSIELIKKKWEDDTVDYVYMCSQLKSIRQDLTVQHIQTDFTVYVYETHARVALESDDLNEYNQCQTQLKQLYAMGLTGNEMEFIAYRILYYVYLLGNKKYQSGSSDIGSLLASLSLEAQRDAAVKHALQVRKALQHDNYHQFFRLYKVTPNMGNYILDLIIDSLRLKAMQRICRGYKPNVSAEFVINELAFEDSLLGLEFLKKIGGILEEIKTEECTGTFLNTKDTVIDSSAIFTQEKLLL